MTHSYSLSPSRARYLLPPHCPAKFLWRLDNPEPPKTAWEDGEIAHKLLLGEGRDVVVIDADNFKTKAAQEARDKARADDKIPALPSQVARAEAMIEQVHLHPAAGSIFADGDAEFPMEVEDPDTGVLLRGRLDWMTQVGGRVWIVDYKSAQSAHPGQFARKAVDFGYHMQGAWYRRMAQLLEVDLDPRVVFVVQEKEPPYLLSVIELDASAMELGRTHMRNALDLYVWCRENAQWPAYSSDIETVSLPGWAYRTQPQGD